MKPFFETVMAPVTGWAQVVTTGQRLRVTDLEGLQVVDMAVFNARNVREKLSTSYSRSRAGAKGSVTAPMGSIPATACSRATC